MYLHGSKISHTSIFSRFSGRFSQKTQPLEFDVDESDE